MSWRVWQHEMRAEHNDAVNSYIIRKADAGIEAGLLALKK